MLSAELEPLCDEGEAFGARLQRAGVPVRVVRAARLAHGFARLTAHSDAAARAVAGAARAMGAALA